MAKHFNTEIVSADSRQFFKEIHIGTAAPSQDELNEVQHHFIKHKSILNNYNVGSFEKEALTKLTQLFKKHDYVIMVGGSGLYVDAITKGLDDFPSVSPLIRKQLNDTLMLEGIKPLQKQLQSLDITTYNTIAIQNPHRVIRALEICIGTGKPYSSFLNKKVDSRSFKTVSIGLTADRPIIYERINQRVDQMIQNGLLEEVKRLAPYKSLNALNTVGYKELFEYLDGNCTLDFAISEIKKNTRRFAKRQLTWFKKNENILWFDHKTPQEQIIKAITEKTE